MVLVCMLVLVLMVLPLLMLVVLLMTMSVLVPALGLVSQLVRAVLASVAIPTTTLPVVHSPTHARAMAKLSD